MSLSWSQIFRLGLVQMALGSIVVLTTSTLNRLMVVELSCRVFWSGCIMESNCRVRAGGFGRM